jgi:hypothetical protein
VTRAGVADTVGAVATFETATDGARGGARLR